MCTGHCPVYLHLVLSCSFTRESTFSLSCASLFLSLWLHVSSYFHHWSKKLTFILSLSLGLCFIFYLPIISCSNLPNGPDATVFLISTINSTFCHHLHLAVSHLLVPDKICTRTTSTPPWPSPSPSTRQQTNLKTINWSFDASREFSLVTWVVI